MKRQADRQRKTQHTVEAISLDDSRSWIGINQVMVARCADPPNPTVLILCALLSLSSKESQLLAASISVLSSPVTRRPRVLAQWKIISRTPVLSAQISWGHLSFGVCPGRYVGHFLQAGGMPEICQDPEGLKAEQKVIATMSRSLAVSFSNCPIAGLMIPAVVRLVY